MQNKYLKFVKWLDKKKQLEFVFDVGVLEEHNLKKDASLPTPPLSHLDSRSLFSFLVSEGLATQLKENVFELNRVAQWKWNNTIRELKKSDWRRHPFWIRVCKSLSFILIAFAGGLVGAYSKEIGSILFHKTNEIITQTPASESGNGDTNTQKRNPKTEGPDSTKDQIKRP